MQSTMIIKGLDSQLELRVQVLSDTAALLSDQNGLQYTVLVGGLELWEEKEGVSLEQNSARLAGTGRAGDADQGTNFQGYDKTNRFWGSSEQRGDHS